MKIKKLISRYSLFIAWVIAMVATFGSLVTSSIFGIKPCPFCWYQRIFIFPLCIILGIAAYRNDKNINSYVIALPFVGGIIALLQTIFYNLKITTSFCGTECLEGNIKVAGVDFSIFSFLAFLMIFLLLLIPKKNKEKIKRKKTV